MMMDLPPEQTPCNADEKSCEAIARNVAEQLSGVGDLHEAVKHLDGSVVELGSVIRDMGSRVGQLEKVVVQLDTNQKVASAIGRIIIGALVVVLPIGSGIVAFTLPKLLDAVNHAQQWKNIPPPVNPAEYPWRFPRK